MTENNTFNEFIDNVTTISIIEALNQNNTICYLNDISTFKKMPEFSAFISNTDCICKNDIYNFVKNVNITTKISYVSTILYNFINHYTSIGEIHYNTNDKVNFSNTHFKYCDKVSFLKLYIGDLDIDIQEKYFNKIISCQINIIEYLFKYFNKVVVNDDIIGGYYRRVIFNYCLDFKNNDSNSILKLFKYNDSTLQDILNDNSLDFINSYLEYRSKSDVYLDAGFDIFVPENYEIHKGESIKIDMKVKAAMYYNNIPISFYMYPRSSTGSKTPLRLSNSVGIIDAGYRGNCMGIFDQISAFEYNINKGDRLVQFCNGNMNLPIFPIIVNNVSELGITTRGSGGFGSTGK